MKGPGFDLPEKLLLHSGATSRLQVGEGGSAGLGACPVGRV